jgi:LuxR family maltose regulon positive regulatory protein
MYSLAHGDNDPSQFLTYLVYALRSICNEVGSGILPALESPQPPGLEASLTHVINDLDTSGVACGLVLDDLHALENPDLWEALVLLVNNQPEGLNLVITTREDPPLPLAQLRARGEMLELRADSLMFSEDEAAEYLSKVMGIEPTEDQIRAIENRTEGWIAGLQLAAISMQGERERPAFIEAFSGSHRFILDYLSDEVMEGFPDEISIFFFANCNSEPFERIVI